MHRAQVYPTHEITHGRGHTISGKIANERQSDTNEAELMDCVRMAKATLSQRVTNADAQMAGIFDPTFELTRHLRCDIRQEIIHPTKNAV